MMNFPQKQTGQLVAKGADYLVYIRRDIYQVWTPLGGQRDGSLDLERDIIDMTESRSDGWEGSRAGAAKWSIDLSALVIVNNEAALLLRELFLARQPVLVQIRFAGDIYCTGTGNISDLDMDFPQDGAAEITGTIEGNGPLIF